MKTGPGIAGFSFFFTAIGNFEAFHEKILSRSLLFGGKAFEPATNTMNMLKMKLNNNEKYHRKHFGCKRFKFFFVKTIKGVKY